MVGPTQAGDGFGLGRGGGWYRRRWSRVAVKYQGWGFTSTDKLVPEDRRNQNYRTLRDRAERIADGD